MPDPLRSLLEACSILAGQTKPPSSASSTSNDQSSTSSPLCKLLNQRIAGFYEIARRDGWLTSLPSTKYDGSVDERQSKLSTARLALSALGLLSDLEANSSASAKKKEEQAPPVYGLKDTKTITILCGLIARWGIGTLLPGGILPPDMQDKQEVNKVEEITADQEENDGENEEEMLRKMVDEILGILMHDKIPNEGPGARGAKQLRMLVLPGLMLHTLAALLYLSHTASASVKETSDMKSTGALESLLNLTNPSTSLATLLALLAVQRGSSKASQVWLAPMLSSLLSKQLLRKGGILGLLNVLLGRSESELQITQLEHIAKVLSTPPSGMSADAYFSIILPRIISLIQPPITGRPAPASYIRALCFCISRLISTAPQALTKNVLPHFSLSSALSSSSLNQDVDIEGQLELLTTLISHIDPSPTNYAFILHPSLITKLFSAWSFVKDTKGDPILRESIENLLKTWGRSLSVEEVADGLKKVVEQAEEWKWKRTESGGIAPRSTPTAKDNKAAPAASSSTSTSKFLLDDDEVNPFKEEHNSDDDNPTLIRPNPEYITEYLHDLARPGLSSTLLLLWLDEMRLLQARAKLPSFSSISGETPFLIQKKIVLRLQLILGIIDRFGPEEIVKEPKKMLAFVDLALERDNAAKEDSRGMSEKRSGKQKERNGGLSMKDLKIVEVDSEDEESEHDEEDPDALPEMLGLAKGEELIITGLTLLLSILEGNDIMNFDNTPLLHDLSIKLDALVENASSTAAELARNAKIVLTSRRLASTSTPSPHTNGKDNDDIYASSRKTYQEALKLLQDPLLPIRAQGLSLLRSLISSKSSFLSTDAALLPGILDIFIQSIQDEDSFIYLNAVQGLAALASGYGRHVVRKLVEIYVSKGKDVGEGEKGRRELDKRLRIAETINQVVQQSGDALAVYVDILLPSLLHTMRSSDLPVALRSSALTILAICAESAPLALLSEINTLIEACLDLLSIESASKNVFRPIVMEERNKVEETLDPLECASTHPSLRRGAILFLVLLVRAMQEKGDVQVVHPRTARRLGVVVGYVRDTDPDALVRHNAGVLLDEL